MSLKGKLYLIPTVLGESPAEGSIPAGVLALSRKLNHFIVENERTARRYLKSIHTEIPLDDLQFGLLNKQTEVGEYANLMAPLLQGTDMGLISEAGLPAIADPGAAIVAECHRQGIRVVPCTGPTSIVLALIASGFDGQSFAFHGYLPIMRKERTLMLRTLEAEVKHKGSTQIFMETPFRNDKLLAQLIDNCHPTTVLCIATDITLASEKISTKTLTEWQRNTPSLHKRPCMFLMGRLQS